MYILEIAYAKKCNPQVEQQHAIKEKEDILTLNKYQSIDFVSMDQFVVSISGQLPTGYGWEGDNNRFHGGTIFIDAAPGTIWVENQVSLGAGEINIAKTCFKEWFWDLAFAEIKHIHSDNDVFTADIINDDCIAKHQSQIF